MAAFALYDSQFANQGKQNLAEELLQGLGPQEPKIGEILRLPSGSSPLNMPLSLTTSSESEQWFGESHEQMQPSSIQLHMPTEQPLPYAGAVAPVSQPLQLGTVHSIQTMSNYDSTGPSFQQDFVAPPLEAQSIEQQSQQHSFGGQLMSVELSQARPQMQKKKPSEKRKVSHKAIEARRREKINDRIARLKDLVGSHKEDKGSILADTVEFIMQRELQYQSSNSSGSESTSNAADSSLAERVRFLEEQNRRLTQEVRHRERAALEIVPVHFNDRPLVPANSNSSFLDIPGMTTGEITISMDMGLLGYNQGILKLTGLSVGEMEGRSCASIFQMESPDDAIRCVQHRAILLAGKHNFVQQPKKLVRKDGSLLPVSITLTLKRDKVTGAPDHFKIAVVPIPDAMMTDPVFYG